MNRRLYAEWLKEEIRKSERLVAELRPAIEQARLDLAADEERLAVAERELEEERAELARETTSAAAERLVGPTRSSPHEADAAVLVATPITTLAPGSIDTLPHEPVRREDPEKRLSEQQKREFLIAHGWTEHREIADQNIRVCWENGGKWVTLEAAYDLVITEKAKARLRADGWTSSVDPIDEIERWRRAGSDFMLFHEACAQLPPVEPGALS